MLSAAICAVAVVLGLTVPAAASATVALERDRVQGDTFTVYWSPGSWGASGTPLPDCTTFPSGTYTGPGHTTDADSLICATVANSWTWTVTVPGPYTINWGMNNFPPGIEVCAQIFYFSGRPGSVLSVEVDLERDWMVVKDEEGNVLYAGSFEGFYPFRREGVVITEARRCGLVRILPTGACCFINGYCIVFTEQECLAAFGVWQGAGTGCDPNPCPQYTGACCYADGSCQVLDATECSQYGGTFLGAGTSCVPNPCPPPTGACCFADATCQVLTEAECQQAQGSWQGLGTDCDPNPCPPVPTEQKSWGRIKAIYR